MKLRSINVTVVKIIPLRIILYTYGGNIVGIRMCRVRKLMNSFLCDICSVHISVEHVELLSGGHREDKPLGFAFQTIILPSAHI